MSAEPDRDFFVCAGIEWAAIDTAVRNVDPSGDDPLRAIALGMWREAAWCHLLFKAGKYAAVLAPLRAVRGLKGPGPVEPDAAQTLAAAADILSLLRSAVAARYPLAFAPVRRSA